MRKIINHLRPWCALFFAVAIGGNAFAEHPTNHSPELQYTEPRYLHNAVQHDKVDEARRLIAAGSDVNQRFAEFRYGWAPLHYAAVYGHKDMALLLINSGANLEAADTEGRTPLFLAAEFGDPNVVKQLLHAGAQYKAGPGKQRMIHAAALNRYHPVPILQMLLPLDSSPYSHDADGNNILHYAASNRERTGWWSLKLIEEIYRHLDKKKMYRAKNRQGNTPYDQAAWLHEQSKKYDQSDICVNFLWAFNACAPQRRAGVLDLLR